MRVFPFSQNAHNGRFVSPSLQPEFLWWHVHLTHPLNQIFSWCNGSITSIEGVKYHNYPLTLYCQKNVVITVLLFCEMSIYRWLDKCLAIKESISKSSDFTWFHLSLNFWKKCFFTNAINVYVFIFIIDIKIIIILPLLTAMEDKRKHFWKSIKG